MQFNFILDHKSFHPEDLFVPYEANKKEGIKFLT